MFPGRRFTALVLRVFVSLAKETQIRLLWHELPGNTLQNFALPAFLLNCLGLWTFVYRNQSCLSYCLNKSINQIFLLTAASEVSNNSPCSSFPDFYSVCCRLPPQPSFPLKMGQTLHSTSQRLRRKCEITLEFEKSCIWRETFFSCMKPNFIHKTEEFEDLMETFPLKHQSTCPCSVHRINWANTSAVAEVVQQRLQPSQPQTWLRWRQHLVLSAHSTLSKRQTGDITGVQRVITKVSSGHTSCIRTHTAI